MSVAMTRSHQMNRVATRADQWSFTHHGPTVWNSLQSAVSQVYCRSISKTNKKNLNC